MSNSNTSSGRQSNPPTSSLAPHQANPSTNFSRQILNENLYLAPKDHFMPQNSPRADPKDFGPSLTSQAKFINIPKQISEDESRGDQDSNISPQINQGKKAANHSNFGGQAIVLKQKTSSEGSMGSSKGSGNLKDHKERGTLSTKDIDAINTNSELQKTSQNQDKQGDEPDQQQFENIGVIARHNWFMNFVKPKYTAKQQAGRATVLLLIFLVHIIIISVSTSLLVLYKYDSKALTYINLALQGFFLGVASTSLNYEMIRMTWKGRKDRQSACQRMFVAYLIIIGINMTITIEVNIHRIDNGYFNPFVSILIEILALTAGVFIYFFYTMVLSKFCPGRKEFQMKCDTVTETEQALDPTIPVDATESDNNKAKKDEGNNNKDIKEDANASNISIQDRNDNKVIKNGNDNKVTKGFKEDNGNKVSYEDNDKVTTEDSPNKEDSKKLQKKKPQFQKCKLIETQPQKFSIKAALLTQLMIIFPFCQLLASVGYAIAFRELEDKNRFWDLFLLCLSYPIAIGILKTSMEKIAENGKLKMKFYVEYLSIAFAALPFRVLFLESESVPSIVSLILAKYLYKVSFYLILGTNLEKVKSFIDRKSEEVEKSNSKLKKKIFSKAIQAAELEFEGDMDGMDVLEEFKNEPYMVEFAMKYILIMFSDIFSTISLSLIVKMYHDIDNQTFEISDDNAKRFIIGSMVDLSLDVLLVIVTAIVWRRSNSKIKKIDLISMAIAFFKRYYAVFIAANFNLFHSLFIVLVEVSKGNVR